MRKIVLFTVTFLSIVALGSMAMAKQRPAYHSVISLEKSSPKEDTLSYASLMTVGYVVSNWYAAGPEGNSRFMTFDMYGVPLKNPAGEFLGSIDDIFMDHTSHDVLAITNIGSHDRYGESGGITAIPIAALKISETKSGKLQVLLNSTEMRLVNAPIFDPTKIDNPKYVAHIYRYYGIQPYWTESHQQ